MDLNEFRRILSNSAVDIWSFIDTAIAVAASDYGHELKDRRDEIVQRLYACRNCGEEVDHRRIVQPVMKVDNQAKLKHSPYTPQSVHREDDVEVDVVNDDDEEEDPYAGLFDDEETRILRIKEQIEDPEQVSFK